MVRCGIIGCGVIAPTHIAGYKAIPGASVVHICDIDAAKLEKLGAECQIGRRSTDYRELLADPEVDLVSICTDHASHAQIACDALAAGKHVVCEKSLGHDYEDLRRMVAASSAHPELVASGIFQHRFEERNIALKKLVAEGAFGTLLSVNLNFNCLRTAEYYNHDAWRGTLAGEGGGVLINQAIHHLDQLRFLFGEVRAVTASTANLAHQGVIEVEDTAAFLLEFESGLFGTVTATNASREDWRSMLTVNGSAATLYYDNETCREVAADEALGARIRAALSAERLAADRQSKSYYGGGHTAQLFDVVQAVAEHRAPGVKFAESANSTLLVLAVYESARQHKRIELKNFRS